MEVVLPARALPMRALRPWLLGLLAAALSASLACAQASRCTVTSYMDPPRQVLRCADGFMLSAESSTSYRLIDRNGDGRPEAAELTGQGLLIEVPRGQRQPFQVLTPHAIASVRGTVWAVDVRPTRTSVFVEDGVVAVSRRGAPATVELRAGDGVDVDAGGQDLRVNRWSRVRAANLLARFGR